MTRHANKVLGVFTLTLCLLVSLAEARNKSIGQGRGPYTATSTAPSSQAAFTLPTLGPSASLPPGGANVTLSDLIPITGGSDFSVAGATGGGITYTASPNTRCTVSNGVLTPVAPGSCDVTVTRAGGTIGTTTYSARSAGPVQLLIPGGTTDQTAFTLTGVTNGGEMEAGATATLGTSGGSTTRGGGGVIYAVASGDCTISGTTLTAAPSAGNCSFTVSKPGGVTHANLTETVTLRVTAPTFTLTLPVGTDVRVRSTPAYNLRAILATGAAGGTTGMDFTVSALTASGVCTIAGNNMTAVAAGTCIINATKTVAGGATNATGTINITIGAAAIGTTAQNNLTMSCSTLPTPLYAGTSYNLSYYCPISGGSAGAFSYVVGGECTTTTTTSSGDINVQPPSVGSCTITATRAGDATYAAKTSTSVTRTVAHGTQSTFTLTCSTNTSSGTGLPATLAVMAQYNLREGLSPRCTVSGGSGNGAVTYSTDTPTKCVVGLSGSGSSAQPYVQSTLDMARTGAGTCRIIATKAGGSTYADATSSVTRNTLAFP